MAAQPTVLLESFYKWEKEQPNKVFLKQPFGDEFKDFTFVEAGQQARKLVTYLQSLNLPEHSNIGLVSKNCAEWIIADLAIMMAGHISVPFYATLNAEQINQVLTHSGCSVLFVGKLDDWNSMKDGIPEGVHCIAFPTYNPDPAHTQWNSIMDSNKPYEGRYVPNMNDIFSIVYTSGTTGNPKGVVLTQATVAHAVSQTGSLLLSHLSDTRFFSYLPLCHIAERNLVEVTSIITGGTIYFAESLESFAKNLAVASPTHFLAVPRIWTKFQQGISAKMPEKKLNLMLKIPILNNIVKKKIRTGLGLNDAKLIITGAAPMPESLIKWFRRLGIVIQEAYGMTENLGAVCMMPPSKIKDGTVGQLYPGVEVKIAEDTGEILMRSDWVMTGYYREPAITNDTIRNGWLHTGDVGELDDERYLKITGRVKEMYKTSKGEYIAPSQIEFGFADNKFIDQVCIVGQSLPQPIALVVLSEIGNATDPEEVKESLKDTLQTLNPRLKSYERVKKIVVMKNAWTVDNNMLTPTMKIKRNVIEKTYNARLESWYEVPGSVLWED
jgi:long-chain acyl-CoA synthetase